VRGNDVTSYRLMLVIMMHAQNQRCKQSDECMALTCRNVVTSCMQFSSMEIRLVRIKEKMQSVD